MGRQRGAEKDQDDSEQKGFTFLCPHSVGGSYSAPAPWAEDELNSQGLLQGFLRSKSQESQPDAPGGVGLLFQNLREEIPLVN